MEWEIEQWAGSHEPWALDLACPSVLAPWAVVFSPGQGRSRAMSVLSVPDWVTWSDCSNTVFRLHPRVMKLQLSRSALGNFCCS